jgi:hypothetical protein
MYLHHCNLRGVQWDNCAFIVNTYGGLGCGAGSVVVIIKVGVEVVCAVGLWGSCRLCVSYRTVPALILQRRRRFVSGT